MHVKAVDGAAPCAHGDFHTMLDSKAASPDRTSSLVFAQFQIAGFGPRYVEILKAPDVDGGREL